MRARSSQHTVPANRKSGSTNPVDIDARSELCVIKQKINQYCQITCTLSWKNEAMRPGHFFSGSVTVMVKCGNKEAGFNQPFRQPRELSCTAAGTMRKND